MSRQATEGKEAILMARLTREEIEAARKRGNMSRRERRALHSVDRFEKRFAEEQRAGALFHRVLYEESARTAAIFWNSVQVASTFAPSYAEDPIAELERQNELDRQRDK